MTTIGSSADPFDIANLAGVVPTTLFNYGGGFTVNKSVSMTETATAYANVTAGFVVASVALDDISGTAVAMLETDPRVSSVVPTGPDRMWWPLRPIDRLLFAVYGQD